MIEAKQHTIESLGLSLRARTCLAQAGINTIEELLACAKHDLIRLPHLGRTTLASIVDRLSSAGLALHSSKPVLPQDYQPRLGVDTTMNSSRAFEIINMLACGVDPITGEVFPTGSALQHPDIVRALFLAANSIRSVGAQSEPSSATRMKNVPANAGKSWSEAEDQELILAFEMGDTEKKLAAKHKRTTGAIRSRLVKLGKLEPYGIPAVALQEAPPTE